MTRRARLACLAALGLLAAAAAIIAADVATLPDVRPLATRNPATTAFIERYRARLRAEGQDDQIHRQPVPLARIAPALALAVLVSEDIGFFSHHGFELAEMRAALRDAVARGGTPRGASTITQQLAKNLWLSPSRNPLRKLREAILTRRLERELSKERILELYLNAVEFGPGIWGAEAAAQRYFSKPAADVNEHESALLASALSRPSTWNPVRATEAYLAQVGKVEARMARVTFLRQRLGLPAVDTTHLPPDTLLLVIDSLLRADTLPAGDTLVGRDTLANSDTLMVLDTLVKPDTMVDTRFPRDPTGRRPVEP